MSAPLSPTEFEAADRLARDAALALRDLMDLCPSMAWGLVREAALSLPDYPRPTRRANTLLPQSTAERLREEAVGDITNWADLATQFDLLTVSMASLQRLRPGFAKWS